MISGPGLIKSYYNGLPSVISSVRKNLNRPLSLTEKILYAHLPGKGVFPSLRRGIDYVEFAPDRVAMQDSTAQMALLPFIMAGKDNSARTPDFRIAGRWADVQPGDEYRRHPSPESQ